MPVSGYDPDDLDDALEARLSEDQLASLLTDDERTAYREGDASLVDLLESSEIEAILDGEGADSAE
jgi:hypothetical protein